MVNTEITMITPEPVLSGDLIWGAQAIADYIKRPVRSVYYLIDRGILPVTKLGPRTIVARASEIDRALSNESTIGTNKTSSRGGDGLRADR
jgi:hypothetical protein